jgi:hypothetical protein
VINGLCHPFTAASRYVLNRTGERRHPCLTPWLLTSNLEGMVPLSMAMNVPLYKFTIVSVRHCGWEPGSSVSIVSDYGLDDRAIGVRSPAGAKDFSSILCVQTVSEASQPPVQCVPGVLSPWPGLDADHSPPSSAEFVNE